MFSTEARNERTFLSCSCGWSQNLGIDASDDDIEKAKSMHNLSCPE